MAKQVWVGEALGITSVDTDRWGQPYRWFRGPMVGRIDAEEWAGIQRYQHFQTSEAALRAIEAGDMEPAKAEIATVLGLSKPHFSTLWTFLIDRGRPSERMVTTCFMAATYGAAIRRYRWPGLVVAAAQRLLARILNSTVRHRFPIGDEE